MEKKNLIYSNIDSVYMNVKNLPNSILIMVVILIVITFINNTLLWNIINLFGFYRQNIYCYNPYSNTLELCDKMKLCSINKTQDITYLIYDNDYYDNNISNTSIEYFSMNSSRNYTITNITSDDPKNFLNELNEVNRKYINFFNILFNKISINYRSTSINDNIYSLIKMGVVFTKFEPILLYQYRCICDNNNDSFLFSLVLFTCIIMGIIVSVLADIYGRYRLLIIGLILIFIGCFLFSILNIYLKNEITTETNFNFKQNYTYPDYIKNIQSNKFYREKYSNYKFLIFFSIFIILFGILTVHTSSLCLLLEFSLNDNQAFNNFLYFYIAKSLSFYFFFCINFIFRSPISSYFFIGVITFILTILSIIYLKESPRFHYEYSNYHEMTKILEDVFDEETLKKFYKNNKDENFHLINSEKQNYENMKSKAKTKYKAKNGIITQWNNIKFFISLIRYNTINKKITYICKDEIRSKPFLIITHLYYVRSIRRNLLIILSLVALVKMNYRIISVFLLSKTFYSRKIMYSFDINAPQLKLTLVLQLSNVIFYYIMKFFGIKKIFIICFSILFIFTMVSEKNLIFLPINDLWDFNLYNYGKIKNLDNIENEVFNHNLIYVFTFFINGMNLAYNLHLINYTKTIYRATFFGFVMIISYVCLIISTFIVVILKHILLSLMMYNFIGFMICFFLEDENDYNIVSDKRSLEVSYIL